MEFISLYVLGSGGTGSYFLKEVSRYIAGNPTVKEHICSAVICDGDTVEEKNLGRQNFMREDIGRAKANVMAEVLNEAFDLDWTSVPHYLERYEDLCVYLPEDAVLVSGDVRPYQDDPIPVIIGCVDNHAARMVCESFFERATSCVYLDAANEFEDGECVFAYKFNGRVLAPCRSTLFPEIKKGDLRPVTEMSCEELNNSSPQHIFTNMASALQLLAEFSNFCQDNPSPGLVFFNPHKHYVERIGEEVKSA